MKRVCWLFILLFCSPGIGLKAHPRPQGDLEADTVRIRQLFEKGYEFIDGPSDSLLHYFGQALAIIDDRLEILDQKGDSDIREVFSRMRWRVFIEFGIEHFFRSDYPAALDYFRQSLDIALQLEDPALLTESYSEIGIVLKNQGKLDEALENLTRSLEMAKRGTDTSWVASCMVNLGNVYKEKGFLVMAQSYYLDALSTLELLDHARRIAACYQNIGEVYFLQHDLDRALEYFEKALRLAVEENDRVRETAVHLNIGNVYLMKGELEKSRAYLNRALGNYRESGYSHEMDDCYILLGDTYFGERKVEEAERLYLRARDISLQEQDHQLLAEAYCKLAGVNLARGRLPQAEGQCLECLGLAIQTAYIEKQAEAHELLTRIYQGKGDLHKALEHYRLFSHLKDSIFSAEQYKAIAELEIKYASDKKEQQLALYREQGEVQRLKILQKNRMLIAAAAGIFMIILIAYLLFRQSRMRSKQKSLEMEQKLLRSQMNPHFIFNSLIAIQSYIYKKEAVVAGDYLASFAELVRFTLDSSRMDFIPLDKEVRMMQAYLELQKLRFEQHFDFEVVVDDELDPVEVSIPPMFAQPFIENSVEHGLRHREMGGFVKVSYRKVDEECVRINIRDNGIGREEAGRLGEKSGHHSMGMTITRERLEILSRKFRRKFNLRITDLKNEQGENDGVEVVIEIPVQ